MTPSEKFVYELSKHSFLSLWSYANPKGKKDKELCDVLILCEPHIIIISVKEITPTESGDFNTDFKRWKRSAMDKSFNQIYGAERYLNSVKNIKLNDGSIGPRLPKKEERIYHRVAIVIGGEKNMPILWGDQGKGFIHVFDLISTEILFSELDTITDFVKYLSKKEEFYRSGNFSKLLFEGGEEDLLAYYLDHSEEFDLGDSTLTIITSGLWEGYKNGDANKKWMEDIKDSRLWDNMIETLTEDFRRGNLEVGKDYDNFELVVRTMARESRYNRILLSKEFLEAYELANVMARVTASYSGIVYIFMFADRDEDRHYRRAELGGRCLVVRRLTPDTNTVIGITTEKKDGKKGFSLDVVYFYKPKLSTDDENKADEFMEMHGWFKKQL